MVLTWTLFSPGGGEGFGDMRIRKKTDFGSTQAAPLILARGGLGAGRPVIELPKDTALRFAVNRYFTLGETQLEALKAIPLSR